MPSSIPVVEPLYATDNGAMYHGNAESLLEAQPITAHRGHVQLILTSPPFPLNRKKKYGNLTGKEYMEWLASFASTFREYLSADGSIVIELGNAWEPQSPTMSTLPMRSLLAFQDAADLHLCQEFICFNPARLPSPAQWVNVEHIRVKDAFTRVWWLAPSERPKADNHRVLTEYSDAMKRLLRRGTYNAGTRPSEHNIGDRSFLRDRGGAVPPNVLAPPAEDLLFDLYDLLPIANTGSADPYQEFCRARGLDPHPARMPQKLVEFFVKFVTDPGDTVLDPFAGSNTTGFVAESLERRWLAIEADETYASTSEARFRDLPVADE